MMREWLPLALSPAVVRRSLKYALVVGAILITINHGSALLHGGPTKTRLWQIGLTLLVPYFVSTAASVGALREARRLSSINRK